MFSFKFSIVRIRCGTGLKKYSSFDVYFGGFFWQSVGAQLYMHLCLSQNVMQWSPIEFFSLYVLFSHGGLKEILPCLLYIMPMYAHRYDKFWYKNLFKVSTHCLHWGKNVPAKEVYLW